MADILGVSAETTGPIDTMPTKPRANKTSCEAIGISPPAHMPRKRFYRQRAHCNPFSDHNIDLYFYGLCNLLARYLLLKWTGAHIFRLPLMMKLK